VNVFERVSGRSQLDVSTEEWELPDEIEPSRPAAGEPAVRFPVAFRGYDRATVDEYLQDVSRVIEQLESAQSPDAAVKRELEQIGEQTTAILQRAHEAEETITTRARAEADETLRAAEQEARATRERAEARVRELDEDTELLWQERHRLLEDMQRLFNQVGRVMAAANKRFPGPTPAPASGPEPDEPAEGLAALDARTVDGDEDDAEGGDAEPETAAVDDLAPVEETAPPEEEGSSQAEGEESPQAQDEEPSPLEAEEPSQPEDEQAPQLVGDDAHQLDDDEPTPTRTSAGLLDEELHWEDAPEYRPPSRNGRDDAWHPHADDAAISAYRVEQPDRQPRFPAGRPSLLDRLLSPRSSDHT